ncbi:Fic family protein [Clostridium pasteurianum]|uniref:Fic family protein n=1 Tax=Clostridium pasteurianum TaxID=1501 RepID=UPI002260CD1C|nr:Fic family protein [Clostridium pasteurianum]UZW12870.1 Fic family protein [Clostridium pasteurianum]
MLYDLAVKVWKEGDKDQLIKRFFPKFTYFSNKIKNDETRLRDVEAVFKGEKVLGFNGNMKTIKEIENHRDLCNNILQLAKENSSKLSINLIKQVHYELMKGCFTESIFANGENSGDFRNSDLNYSSVNPIELEEKLRRLVEEINKANINESNVLGIVGYFHCSLLNIKPFPIDNGRMGRVLFNYLLMGNNLPPIIISYLDKEKYYFALEHFSKNKDITKMVNFLDNQAYKTWNKDYKAKTKRLKDFL